METKESVTVKRLVEDLRFFVEDCLNADFFVEDDGIHLVFADGERFFIKVIRED